MSAENRIEINNAELVLVNWLTKRTQQGQLTWLIKSNTITLTIPGSISFRFMTCQTSISRDGWCLFSACGNQGELIRTFPAHAPADTSPLTDAVAALFRVINNNPGVTTPCANLRVGRLQQLWVAKWHQHTRRPQSRQGTSSSSTLRLPTADERGESQ